MNESSNEFKYFAIGCLLTANFMAIGQFLYKNAKNSQKANSSSIVSENNYSNTVFYGIRPVNIDNFRKDLETKFEEKQKW